MNTLIADALITTGNHGLYWGGPISYYPRPLFTDFRNWFDDNLENTPIPNRKDRETNILKFLTTLEWK